MEGNGEQCAGFKGRVLWVGQVEEGQRGAGFGAEPIFNERLDGGCGGGKEVNRDFVFGKGVGGEVVAGVGGSDGEKEAGGFEAEESGAGVGGGDAGDFLIFIERAGLSNG